eukprot:TRINITY_DN16484_c0_g1_i1.p4 TRINITY_DN16484_c0_g1~~TRINITY_DN16484_c0_g1_i1.p4  ORF type:complete len:65 (+),score=1.36 TRINITY_DN16484_c0_g1_i1:242-436(+)
MDGQVSAKHKTPSALPPLFVISLPVCGSNKIGLTPKKGFVADPGFALVTPGRGVIICPPVSVCQ